MFKFIRFLIPLLLAGLFLAACQAVSPANTATVVVQSTDTRSPATPTLSLTATLPPSPIPAPTDTPVPPTAPPPAQPACFVSAGFIPFAFLPDGVRLVQRNDQGDVQVLNLEALQVEQTLAAPADSMGGAAGLSPDGETLAWVLPDFSIQLVSLADGELLHTLAGHTGIVTQLEFTPDGTQLLSASHDSWVRVWDVASGELVKTFQPVEPGYAPSDVLGLGLAPDGKRLAALLFDGPVNIWDIGSASEVAALGGSGGYDTSDVAYSPDGQYIAADLATGLALWRLSDRAQLLSGINSMAFAFSPDGRYLAYAEIGDGEKIVIASPDGQQRIKLLESPGGAPWFLLFSPDSSRLVSTNGVETHLWRTADWTLLAAGKQTCP